MTEQLWQTLVAVSVSEPEGLLKRDFTTSDLNDVCLRMSRALLAHGASIAYGGVLGSSAEFTETIRESAEYELESHPSINCDDEMYLPFRNYQPWPFYLNQAELSGQGEVCSYVRVEDQPNAPPKGEEFAGRLAHACSRMRRWMADECHARVIVGGKSTKFLGVMPGVLEEALFHMEAGKPLYICGGFGGIGESLATLLSPDAVIDDLLSQMTERWKASGKIPVGDLLRDYPTEEDRPEGFTHDVSRKEASLSYDRLAGQILNIRDQGFANGLSFEDNTRLMKATESYEIVKLVESGLLALRM